MAITRWTVSRHVHTAEQPQFLSARGESRRGRIPRIERVCPPVDIYEDANHIVLKLEVPGMKLEDFDIQLENNALTVRGERRFEKETKEENYHRVERRYGSFARVFTLPNTLDQESVKAHYDAGVLTIELGKRAEAKSKQIKVSVSGATPAGGPKTVESKSTESKPAA